MQGHGKQKYSRVAVMQEQAKTTTLTPNANELFAFKTQADRDGFIADLKRNDPGVRYAVNLDPDTSQPDRWLVAIPKTMFES